LGPALSENPQIRGALASIERARETQDEGDLVTAKRALFETLGLEAGFGAYKTLVERPKHEELRRRRLASLKTFAARRGGAFHQSAQSQPFVVPPPVVVGEGAVGPLAGRARSAFVACLIDARVRVGSALIEAGDCALFDYEPEEQADWQDTFEWDPAVFRAARDSVWVIAPTAAGDEMEIVEAFSLLGDGVREFGHWLLEYIPKYVAAVLANALPSVPVLVEGGLPQTFRQAVELLVCDGSRIIELPRFEIARVRRLWCAPRLFSFPIPGTPNGAAMPPACYAPVIREMARRAERAAAQPTGVERLFLAREPPGPHAVVNQAALVTLAEARGFCIVYPNRLEFPEQVRFVRHASFIVGPSGGAMYLAFFARPGTRLCMLRDSGDVLSAQADMTGIFAEVGLDVTVFTGRIVRCDPVEHNSDFAIDEAAFCHFLDVWLSGG
jgi:Glycosyltransferase 61